MSKLITVFGATGLQGGGVARALLQVPDITVRAITRKPSSEKALSLRSQGAEVVYADLNDPTSLPAAFAGAYGAFVVTDFWELYSGDSAAAKEAEIRQGKAAVDAALAAGVKHYVFSSEGSAQDYLGKDCSFLDSKAIVEKHVKACGIPYTIVHYPCYFECFFNRYPAKRNDDGSYTYSLPMNGPLHGIATEDGGTILAAIFAAPDEFLWKVVGLAGDHITVGKYCEAIGKAVGKDVRYEQIAYDEFAKFEYPAADELAVMFEYLATEDVTFDVEETRRIYPNAQTFEQFVESNKDKFEKALA